MINRNGIRALGLLLLLSVQHAATGQSPTETLTFGFASYQTTPQGMNSQLLPRVRESFAAHGDRAFYATTNGRIVWMKRNGDAGWSYVGPTTPFQAAVNGQSLLYCRQDSVFYISSLGEIHCLVFSGSQWNDTQVYSTAAFPARSNSTLVVEGAYVYFTGTDNRIRRVRKNGTTWVSLGLVVPSQTALVDASSNLIKTPNHIYYYGPNKKVYDLVQVGGVWQCTNWPLVDSAPTVRAGSRLTYEYDNVFYIATNSRICVLSWLNNAWTGGYINAPGPIQAVRSDSQIQFFDGHIYYVGAVTSQMCDLVWSQGVGWTGATLNVSSAPVRMNTDFAVFLNRIPEEGSQSLNHAHHVAYHSSAGHLGLLVYDDKICEFIAFACRDPLDVNQNGTGWDDAQGNIVSGNDGYYCEDCRDSHGATIKLWHAGPLQPDAPQAGSVPWLGLAGQEVFAMNQNLSGLMVYTRNLPTTGITNYPLFWQDEFELGYLDPTKWEPRFSWGNHAPDACCDFFWNDENHVSVSGGMCILNAEHHDPPRTETNEVHWPVVTYTKDYRYSGSLITSEDPNTGHPYNDHFGFTYGYVETRCQAPRGKYFWPAFWLFKDEDVNPDGTPDTDDHDGEDINMFEMEGNGRTFISTLYCTDGYAGCWLPAQRTYAIGFRYYQAPYMYSVDWRPDAVEYYFNRHRVAAFPNMPQHSIDERHHIIFTHALVDVYGRCELEIFPNTFTIDYVRVYKDPVVHMKDGGGDRKFVEQVVEPREPSAMNCIGSYTVYSMDGRFVRSASCAELRAQNPFEGCAPGLYILNYTGEQGPVREVVLFSAMDR